MSEFGGLLPPVCPWVQWHTAMPNDYVTANGIPPGMVGVVGERQLNRDGTIENLSGQTVLWMSFWTERAGGECLFVQGTGPLQPGDTIVMKGASRGAMEFGILRHAG